MYKYAVGFSKTGTICYTSHLDIMRLFNRVIKRAGIKLAYSHGFNPHPKMVFAQPLSLGYTGLNEYIEIETTEDHEPGYIAEKLSELMPPGLDIKGCERMAEGRKTLAAMTVAAEYMIEIPLAESGQDHHAEKAEEEKSPCRDRYKADDKAAAGFTAGRTDRDRHGARFGKYLQPQSGASDKDVHGKAGHRY